MEGGRAMTAATTANTSTSPRAALLLAVALAAGTLAGWWLGRTPARVELQTVRVPLPIECREPVPARPAMPVEALRARPGPVDVDQFIQAALAELARREGYELRILTALNNCRAPVAADMPGTGPPRP
jgi:hypothetical protein